MLAFLINKSERLKPESFFGFFCGAVRRQAMGEESHSFFSLNLL